MESLRKTAIGSITDALENAGESAAAAATDFFDDIMAAEGLDVSAVMPSGLYTTAEIERIARYQAGKLRVDDVDGFIAQVSQSAGHLAYQGGNRTMMYQAGLYHGTSNPSRAHTYALYHSKNRNKAYGEYQVRYARVPQGEETCDFCLMLASRGFVYLTAESAEGWNHTHRNCDCIVVAGVGHNEAGAATSMGDWVQDTELDGFDLEAMRKLHDAWTSKDYDGLSEEEIRQEKLEMMEQIIGRREW